MSRSYLSFLTALAISAVLMPGCKKVLEIDPPSNETASESVFKTDKTAKAALSGLYSTLSQSQTQSYGLTVFTAVSGDELKFLATATSYTELFTNQLDPELSSAPSAVFIDLYGIIYRANSIIEGLTKYTGTTAAARKQFMAEARFLRAYCFFNLLNIFGDVPLVTMTDPNISAFLPRAATTDVYKQIVADLTSARDSLGTDYSAGSGDRIVANKYAAAALLARVYLFTGNYDAAIENATLVIDNKTLYGLVPQATAGTGVFVKNSLESILQFTPYLASTNSSTNEGSTLIPTTYNTAGMTFTLQPALWAQFAANDMRRKWVKDTTISGVSYQIPFKYKYKNTTLAVAAGVSEYPVILRLSEQYLIRAEARARTSKANAVDDLNAVHTRAGLTAITSTDPAVLLPQIAAENRLEFFCELGHRWFTLKRTGDVDAVMKALKPDTWVVTDALYPIPQASRNANPNLTQNLGYRN
jgi:hypothetical protein